MKSKSRGWAWTALSILLAMATVLAACSKSGSNGAEPSGSASAAPGASQSQSDDPDDKKLPGEVSISMFDRGQVSSDEGTYEDNRWVKWIREQSGINVSIVPVPRNQAQEKLNVLIASNQAPDLIWEYDRNYIGQLVTQGVIQPIDEYIEKYSTSYKAYLEQHPELKPYLTFDGKTYAVTTKRAVNTVANHGMWIRQDWLDKLKLKAPTTVEELVEVAKAFKDGDPDGNGKPDTVPIIGYTSFDIYSSFFAAVNNQWYLEDGKMKYGATLDRFADAIGLGLFSVAGVSAALSADMPLFIASMMGVITGIFGGVLRDIVCNEVPMVFRDGKPYAICAFLGNWMFLLMSMYGVAYDFALWSSALFISGLRLITWKFDLRMGR